MTRLCVLLAAVLVWPFPARAHDIGVSKAELEALSGGRYTLSVQTGPAAAHLFAPPMLPAHCRPTGSPGGVQGRGWRRYEFSCDGALTSEHTLDLPWRRDGIMLTARWESGHEGRALFDHEAGTIRVPLAELRASSGSWTDAAVRYGVLGVEHILAGIDHLLFVLALLLVVRGAWMLVKTITSFTIAHSITLGLATLGFVDVPPRPVEVAIALSIVFLCVEIVHAQQGRIGVTYRYPWVVAFAFGLLHGLGFAGALADIGLPPGEIPFALLFFNVGVEVGQLAFVAVAVAPLAFLRRLSDLPILLDVAPAYAIGTLATHWLFERIAAMLPAA